jgi:hypothetical protein
LDKLTYLDEVISALETPTSWDALYMMAAYYKDATEDNSQAAKPAKEFRKDVAGIFVRAVDQHETENK